METRQPEGEQPPAPWIVVTGLDGAGKSGLVRRLMAARPGHCFRLPHHEFVRPCLARSGGGDPFGDVHTDRLLFALDARLANGLLRQWRRSHPRVVSQRGWMDNYVFGAAQGVSYEATGGLLRTEELERASAVICLVAEPAIAHDRIRGDPKADKFETLDFLEAQHRETLRFHRGVEERLAALVPFHGIPAIVIDTSRRTEESVFREAVEFLAEWWN